MIDDTNYLTTALSGVKMASLDASQETTVPSGTLVRRRTLEWMGVGNHFAHLDNIAVVSRMRRERCVLGQPNAVYWVICRPVSTFTNI